MRKGLLFINRKTQYCESVSFPQIDLYIEHISTKILAGFLIECDGSFLKL